MEELRLPTIPCCMCGTMITPNNANMCVQCIRAEVDITEGIQKHGALTQCPKCLKWHVRQDNWMFYEMESHGLLAMILKKINGLSKYKLVDGRFLWTEPHSKRIKVRLIVQGDVLDKVQIQQQVDVEFVVQNRQCMDCIRQSTTHTWKSVVQVRQHINTKRTLFFMEQVIISHGMQEHILDLETVNDGMDVYFADKSHAQHFVQFLTANFPTRLTNSKKLVSADWKSNITNHQYTTVVELVPLARNDLVIVPKAVAPGRRPALLLVAKLTSMIYLVDPITLDRFELTNAKFWRQPFNPLMTPQQLVPFLVMDIEVLGQVGNSQVEMENGGVLAEAEVVKESDFGVNDRSYRVLTHLGHILHPGDTVLGYDIANANFEDTALDGLSFDPQDIILVKKVYPDNDKAKNKKKKRLRSLRGRRDGRQRSAEAEATATEATADVEDADYRQLADVYGSDSGSQAGAEDEEIQQQADTGDDIQQDDNGNEEEAAHEVHEEEDATLTAADQPISSSTTVNQA